MADFENARRFLAGISCVAQGACIAAAALVSPGAAYGRAKEARHG